MPRRAPDAVLQSAQEMLSVPLSHDEVRARGELLATRIGELEGLEEREREFKAWLKDERGPIEGEVKKLSRIVRERAESRPVLVETYADYERGVAVSVRQDTGEAIRERKLDPEERQPTLLPMPKRKGPAQEAAADEPF